MRRREFITLLGGAAVGPSLLSILPARAQDAGRLRRVGVLSSLGESDPESQSMAAAFHQALQDAGWVDGRNLRTDHRWAAGNVSRIQAFAKQLVALQPDVLIGHTTPSTIALRNETTTIPIVCLCCDCSQPVLMRVKTRIRLFGPYVSSCAADMSPHRLWAT
jgi:putative tryptophan/tyrosine transport system substrate-binding protein